MFKLTKLPKGFKGLNIPFILVIILFILFFGGFTYNCALKKSSSYPTNQIQVVDPDVQFGTPLQHQEPIEI